MARVQAEAETLQREMAEKEAALKADMKVLAKEVKKLRKENAQLLSRAEGAEAEAARGGAAAGASAESCAAVVEVGRPHRPSELLPSVACASGDAGAVCWCWCCPCPCCNSLSGARLCGLSVVLSGPSSCTGCYVCNAARGQPALSSGGLRHREDGI